MEGANALAALDPLRLEVAYEPQRERRLPFVRWLRLVPHAATLPFVAVLAFLAALAGLLAVVVSGRYPRACFYVVEGAARWLLRFGAHLMLLTDAYPPFALYDVPSYPLRASLDRPPNGRIARWRPFVAWLLVLPQTVALVVLYVGLLVIDIVAIFSVALDGEFPRGVFDTAVRILRFHCRVGAYALCMTEEYPGFTV